MPEIQEQNTGISKISEIKNNPDKISQIIEELGLQGFSKELLNLYNSLPDDKENNKKQELIKEIEDNKETIDINIDNIIIKYKNYKKEDVVDKKEDVVDKKEDVKDKEVNDALKESNEKDKIQKEELNKAKTRLNDFYKNLGVKDKAEFFKQNPELEKLYNQEKQAKKIEEGSEDDTKILLGVILNNRSIIKTSNGEKIDDGIFKELKDSAVSLGVKYSDKLESSIPENILKRDQQAIINGGFSGMRGGDDVMVKGSKIFYEDNSGVRQTWDTGEHPPVKYLEQDGIKIESKVRYEPNYEYQVKKEGLLGEIGALENFISGKQKEIKSIFNKFKISGSNYEGELTFGEQYNLFTENIDAQIQKAKEESPSDLPFLESMKAKVNSLKDEIKTEFDKYEKAKKDLQELEKKEKSRIPDYKQTMAKNDETIKNNLTYLKSLHLDIFGRNTDEFIALINQHKGSLGYAGEKDIDLSYELNDKNKNLIIKAMSRILGEGGEKLFDKTLTRIIGDENSTTEKIKDRLVKTGAIGENRMDININNIKGILEKGDK